MVFSHVIHISCHHLPISYYFLMQNIPCLVLPQASSCIKRWNCWGSLVLWVWIQALPLVIYGALALHASVSTYVKCGYQFLPPSASLKIKWVNVFEAVGMVPGNCKNSEVLTVIIANSRWCVYGCLPTHSSHLWELPPFTTLSALSNVCII